MIQIRHKLTIEDQRLEIKRLYIEKMQKKMLENARELQLKVKSFRNYSSFDISIYML